MVQYGDQVLFKERYIRKSTNGGYKNGNKKKEWIKREFTGYGIFLGERTIANGTAEFDSEYGWLFSAKEYIKVALISPGPRKNVFYSPIDSLELKPCR